MKLSHAFRVIYWALIHPVFRITTSAVFHVLDLWISIVALLGVIYVHQHSTLPAGYNVSIMVPCYVIGAWWIVLSIAAWINRKMYSSAVLWEALEEWAVREKYNTKGPQ